MTRAPLLWFSYRRSGMPTVTVRVDLAQQKICWHAGDVLEAIEFTGIPFTTDHYVPGWVDSDGNLTPFIDTPETIRLAHQAGAGHFLGWVEAQVASIHAHRVGRPGPSFTPYPVAEIPTTVVGGYPLITAAAVLSRDPVIDLGRRSLFLILRRIGWIQKNGGAWVPTQATITAGLTLHNDVALPGRRTDYNGIRITDTGLRELHRHLGGIATLTTDTPIAALVEV